MAGNDNGSNGEQLNGQEPLSANIDALVAAARERADTSLRTGRYIVTYPQGRMDAGLKSFSASGFRVADARDFDSQAVDLTTTGDAEVLVFPEIGAAVIGGNALASREINTLDAVVGVSNAEIVEPEYFVFAFDENYFRNYAAAVGAATLDELRSTASISATQIAGVTWGLAACAVPSSAYTGEGIKVAVLDTGLDLGHPDFSGRVINSDTFVGQPVQDENGHGTHCIGTACGPQSPMAEVDRYGIAYKSDIFAGKVLSNSGSGSTAGVLAGMNWAIANRCDVISMSLGSAAPVQAAYTRAGNAALANGCLIIAAAGNGFGAPTGSPANSPSIMSVASVDPSLLRSNFSDRGKVELAGPGRDIFSSWPMPLQYNTISGTSMATPHVAACAALWAQSDGGLRGQSLWDQLLANTLPLSQPPSDVGSGLVQAP